MRAFYGLLLVALVSACSNTPTTRSTGGDLSYAAAEKVGMSSERLANINPAMQAYVDDGELVGIVSMVARHGQVVHFEKFGDLNKNTGEEIQLDSIFRIYSMSKPITTVAAMMLYEQGKFQLTDPVEKYLPEFKGVQVLNGDGELEDQARPLTIQMLMSHTAGLTYGVFGNTPVDQQYRKAGILGDQDLAEMVTDLGNIPLQYQPGTRWHYSVSVDVLGRLVEVIAGQPLDAFFEEHIFVPLSMTDTFFEVPADKLQRFGTNHTYNPRSQTLEVSDEPASSQFANDVTFFSGGGGLMSTAEDYMRFSQMLLNGGEFNGVRLLGRKTVDYMTKNHLNGIFADRSGESAQNRPGSGFGLGFGVVVDAPATGVISSEGEYYWGGAAGTIFWIDPVEDLIAIVMVQHMNVQVPLRNAMKALTYGAIIE